MAISQVRAQVNGTWYTLTYNNATGKHEADITPTAISSGQTGGYFPGTVEAKNSESTATLSGSTYPGLRLVVEDRTAPVLIITAPANGFVTGAAAVTVSGTATDSSGIQSVKVNGTAVTVGANGAWSALVSLSNGSNTITVVATDTAGNATTETRTVIRDSTAPTIALTSPTAGQMVSNAAFTVTGTVSDNRGVSGVTVNGGVATVNGGTFLRAITLAEGANTITAIASDEAGNTATATGSVLLDTIPPALNVTYPAGNLITNNRTMTVTGTASDSGSGLESVTVNGAEAVVSGGAFSAGVTLQEGANTVTVTATDRVGHTTTVTRSVLCDTQKPVLTLVSPAEGWIGTNTPTVIFQATDEAGGAGVDPGSIVVELDGVVQTSGVTVSGADIVFIPSSPLSDGQHVITVTVRDRAGNTQSLSVSYGIDTLPPELTIKAPWLRHVVDWESVTVTGTAWDAGSGLADVKVNGISAALDGDGAFSGTAHLDVGENTITVTATDKAGLTSTRMVWMLRLITDRTQEDVDRVTELSQKPWDSFTAEEKAFWLGVVKGAYNASDMNRVGTAVQYLTEELQRRGYDPKTAPIPVTHSKTQFKIGSDGYLVLDEKKRAIRETVEWTDYVWTVDNIPVVDQTLAYLENVEAIRQQLPVQAPAPPADLEAFTFDEANAIEANLVDTDRFFPLMELSPVYSGEAFCGEF